MLVGKHSREGQELTSDSARTKRLSEVSQVAFTCEAKLTMQTSPRL